MKMLKNLERWRTTGAISGAQYDALAALVRKDRFSVFVELNTALYLGVLAFVAGVGWTIETHFANLGDAAILSALTLTFCFSIYYCFSRGLPYSDRRVESSGFAFDYVLYLGCLIVASELAFIETRFALFGDAWDVHVLVSAALFFVAAYRFDNRFVLSLALSTLAAWFGIKLAQFGFGSAGSLRVSALVYGGLVAGMGALLRRLDIKRHFVDTHLHVAATAAFVAMTSGVSSGEGELWYAAGLLILAGVSVAYGVRHRQFAFVAYGALYPYAGLSLKLIDGMSPTGVMAYGLLSGSAMVLAIVSIARRFARDA